MIRLRGITEFGEKNKQITNNKKYMAETIINSSRVTFRISTFIFQLFWKDSFIKEFIFYNQLEESILESLRKLLIYIGKSLLITYQKWIQLNASAIDQKHEKIKQYQNKITVYSPFNEIIKNYEELVSRTSYLQYNDLIIYIFVFLLNLKKNYY